MRIVGVDELKPRLDRRKVIEATREALILQSEGRVQSPLPGELLFKSPPGDCHIKYGHVEGSPTFAIKVATGFYENPRKGIPGNHGLVMVWDATTGKPLVLFNDEGWLTAWRTAAATAIAAATLAPEVTEIGIVGPGLQGGLSVDWLSETLGRKPFAIWGRDLSKARKLAAEKSAAGYEVRAVERISDLLAACNVIVTATPAQAPLFANDLVKPGTHIVAIGADGTGKQELPTELFRRAAHVLTDDTAQCVDHGDYGAAIRAGHAMKGKDVMLGRVLSGKAPLTRNPADITIADLTGIAAEDIAISGLFSRLLAS